MRIAIDLQGCQTTGSRSRGIGRYSAELTKAICRNSGDHELILALNARFAETLAEVRKTFGAVLPSERIRVFQVPAAIGHRIPSSVWRRYAAEQIRDQFLSAIGVDHCLISSLFEGLGDDAATSGGSSFYLTSAVLYDLIPKIFSQVYLHDKTTEDWYSKKLDHLKKTDLLLAISENSRRSAIELLGLADDRVVNISAAADARFRPRDISQAAEDELRRRYGLKRPYVMYTGGIDFRKNLQGLIDAYAQLSANSRAKYQLAIVCSIKDDERRRITNAAASAGLGPDEVVLTGFVSDDDLVDLYNLCHCFVFPSLYEGFGLPALEAMACGAAVIGSSTSSLPEVIGRNDALFDPSSPSAIAGALERLLQDNGYRESLRRDAVPRAQKFTWDRTSKLVIGAIEHLHDVRRGRTAVAPRASKRLRLAYVSPFPPERSGIASYSSELVPELSRHYDLVLIAREGPAAHRELAEKFEVRSAAWFQNNGGTFDRVLYHCGNSAFHRHMLSLLQRYPGVSVLHDFYLSGLVKWLDTTGADPGLFRRELYRSHGYGALSLHERQGEDAAAWAYPANLSIIARSLGVISHSQTMRDSVRSWYSSEMADWRVIPLLRTMPRQLPPKSTAALNLSEQDFLICSFGIVDANKWSHRVLEAFLASDLSRNPRCHLAFVGEALNPDYQRRLLERLSGNPAKGRVHITGFLDGEAYRSFLERANLAVQLRHRSRGETSLAVLDALAHGIPTVVNESGTMAEFPRNCIATVQENFADSELIEALQTLYQDQSARIAMAEASRGHIRENHDPATIAEQYREAIEAMSTSGLRARQLDMISRIAERSVEAKPTSGEVVEVSGCIGANSTALRQRQLLVEVTPFVSAGTDDKVYADKAEWLRKLVGDSLPGMRVEPIYWDGARYRYAMAFTLKLLGLASIGIEDEAIDFAPGDLLLAEGPFDEPAQAAAISFLQNCGVAIHRSTETIPH